MPDLDDVPPPADGSIAGRFRVLGLLGSGGTASVYDALDRDGARVAVKVLHPHLAHTPAARLAFLYEAAVLGPVVHESLCRALAAGEEGDQAWTAWERASGLTLRELVRERGPLPADAAITVAVRVLEGLAALHDAGLVHRDISPSNVVVDLDRGGAVRAVRVIDFGLVDRIGRSTRARDVLRSEAAGEGDGVVGNLQYAAPEQLRGEGVGIAADLYQVAGVLYFALVGEPPFIRGTAEETLRAHQSAPPPTASVRAAGVPVAVDRVIVRALLKDPDARFASAREMAAALSAARTGSFAPATRVLPAATAAVTAVVPAAGRGADVASAPATAAREPVAPRASSPWIWVLAAASVLLVLVVVIAFLPRVSPTVADETTPTPTTSTAPTPTPTASTPTPTPEPPSERAVPAISGMTEAAAREALVAAGFVVGDVQAADAASPAGTVLTVQPEAGAMAAPGTVVSLVIASGWNAVPDVLGLASGPAEQAIAEAGLSPRVQFLPTASAAPGTVLALEPAPTARLQLGATVTVTVASAVAPTAPPTTTPTPTAPATPLPTPEVTP